MESKYGEIKSSKVEFEDGEPLFLLRGQDIFAAATVRFYANLRRSAGDSSGWAHCMDVARDLQEWKKKKIPD